jgi:hypothetical protein
MNRILTVILILFSSTIFSQENLIAIFPDSIRENANAIIKNDKTEIIFSSYNSMVVKKYRVITILNELGLKNMDAFEYMDNSTSIRNIEAIVYNAFGAEIKKIRRKDFKENSVSEGSIITDNRVIYLDYTPVQYPFTMVYQSEISTSNTAFVPSWNPIEDFFVSILNSSVTIKYTPEVKFKYKEFNFNDKVLKTESLGSLSYAIKNFKALRKEELAPSLSKFTPYVIFGLARFQIEGVEGSAENWSTFGKWMNDELLSDTEEIPEETKIKVAKLIGNETDNLKKAKIIYEFVQSKTRYVSIQLGIGGWKPMLAKNVDRLGYGDCKALTNYTRSLLKAFNIPSYYTVVYGDDQKRDIVEDFVSMQGNHVILGVQGNNEEITWLECTSQTLPFGFQGDFTDDRKVLVVSDEVCKIVKTKSFINEQNYQKTDSKVILNDDNSIKCTVIINSKGIIYDNKSPLKNANDDEVKKYYNDYFNIINNKKISKTEIVEDKKSLELNENIEFEANDFIKPNQGKIIVPLNCINQFSFVPKKYKDRKIPFEIDRGFCYEDESIISIPSNFKVETLPSEQNLNNEFGSYEYKIELKNNELVYKRKFLIKKGYYTPDQYEGYRKFREQVARSENSKVLLISK